MVDFNAILKTHGVTPRKSFDDILSDHSVDRVAKPATGYTTPFGTYSDEGGLKQTLERYDTKSLEPPMLDPTMAFAAPAGAVGVFAAKSAGRLVTAGLMTAGAAARDVLFRAGVAGFTSTAAEFALDMPARYAGDVHPLLDPLVRIGGGITSGVTIENYIDRVIKGAMESRQAGKVFKSVVDELRKTKTISELFFREREELIAAANRGDGGAFRDLTRQFREEAYLLGESKYTKQVDKYSDYLTKDTAALEAKVESRIATGGNLHVDDMADLELLATVQATKEYVEGFEMLKKASITRRAVEEYENNPVTRMYKWMVKEGQVIDADDLRVAGFSEVRIRGLKSKYPEMFEKGVEISSGILRKMDSEGWTSLSHMMKDFNITPTLKSMERQIAGREAVEWAARFNAEIELRAFERQAKFISRAYGYNTAKVFKSAAKLDPRMLVGKVLAQAKGAQKVDRLLTKGTKQQLKASARQQVKALTQQRQVMREGIEILKTRSYLRNVFKGTGFKGTAPGYVEQVRHMLRHTLSKTTAVPRQSMFAFIKEKNEMLGFSTVAERFNNLITTSTSKSLNDLSIQELRDTKRFVESFMLAGKAENFINNASRKLYVNDIVSTVSKNLEGQFASRFKVDPKSLLGPKGGMASLKLDKIGRATAQFDAFIARLEPIVLQMDNFVENGPVWKALFRPFIEAERLETLLAETTYSKLRNIFVEHTTGKSKYFRKVVGKLEGYDVSKESALVMYLNYASKNADNIKALSSGLGMTPKAIGKFLDEVITPEDKKLAEGIWDTFDELFAAMAKTHLEQTGLTLQKVKGRYFPIVRDNRVTRTAEKLDDYMLRRDIQKHWAEVEKSPMIMRQGGVQHLRLDLDVVTKHVQDVTHGVTHWGPITDVQRITKNRKFKIAVSDNLGERVYKEFEPWLQNLARPYRVDNTMLRGLRTRVTIGMLGLMPTTAMKQTLSGISAIPKVGVKNMMGAVRDLLKNPHAFFREAREMSVALAHRKHTWQRDVAEMHQRIQGTNKLVVSPKAMDLYFAMIHMMDSVTATTVWRAGYNKSMIATGGNLDEAIRSADAVVRHTQPASLAKDLPRIMRSGELYRASTMFYSYYSVLHNQARTLVQRGKVGNASIPEVVLGLGTMMLMPMMAWEVMSTVGNNVAGRDDDLDLGKAAAAGMMQFAAGVPILRDAVSSMMLGYDYQVSPMVRPIATGTQLVFKAGKIAFDDEAEWTDRDMLRAYEVAGYSFKLPTRFLINALDAHYKNASGELDDAFAYVFKPPREE